MPKNLPDHCSTLAGRTRIDSSTSKKFNKHLSKPCMMRINDPKRIDRSLFRVLFLRNPKQEISVLECGTARPVSGNLCDRDALRWRESEIMVLKGFDNVCRPTLVEFRPHPRTKNQEEWINWLRFSWSGLIPTSSGVGGRDGSEISCNHFVLQSSHGSAFPDRLNLTWF